MGLNKERMQIFKTSILWLFLMDYKFKLSKQIILLLSRLSSRLLSRFSYLSLALSSVVTSLNWLH